MSENRIILTAGAASLLLLAGLTWFSWDPVSAGTTSDFLTQFHKPQLDPTIGERLPIGIELPQAGEKGRVLVVGIGVCTECTASKIDPLPLKGDFAKIVGVFQGERDDYPGKSDKQYIAAFDTAAFLPARSFSKLNSTWVPRAYVLDGKGQLLALQAPGEDINAFVSRWAK